jgi:hypothetical protein
MKAKKMFVKIDQYQEFYEKNRKRLESAFKRACDNYEIIGPQEVRLEVLKEFSKRGILLRGSQQFWIRVYESFCCWDWDTFEAEAAARMAYRARKI